MISVLVATYEKDLKYLPELFKSLNAIDEIVVVVNHIGNGVNEFVKSETYNDTIINWFDFYQSELNFSEILNFGKDQCKGDWILRLDSDERLSCDEADLNGLKLLTDIVGGVRVGVISNYPNESRIECNYQLRLFRNRDYTFVNRCHTDISDSILMQGHKVVDSMMQIRHVGYHLKPSIETVNRNYPLMFKDYLEAKTERNKLKALFHIFRHTQLSYQIGQFEGILNDR